MDMIPPNESTREETVEIADLVIDPEVQLQARGLDPDTVDAYAEAMAQGDEFKPIVVFEDDDGTLRPADGFHRMAAARRQSRTTIETEIRAGDKRAAMLYAATANVRHGRPMSRAEKREAGERLLRLTTKSDTEIARELVVNRATVNRWRTQLIVANATIDQLSGAAAAELARLSRPDPADRRHTVLDQDAARQAHRVAVQIYGDPPSAAQVREVVAVRQELGDVDDETLAREVRARCTRTIPVRGNGGRHLYDLAVEEAAASTPALPISRTPGYDGDEWYTPPEYIAAAREVMGGIDLDPASSAAAQTVVQAQRFFFREDDGLVQPWAGRIWLNPPYSNPEPFVDKLLDEYYQGQIAAALVLVNNATDTNWFHRLLGRYPTCFIRGRVPFWRPGHSGNGGRQGQVVFYLGRNVDGFHRVFAQFGTIVIALSEEEGKE